MGYYREVMAFLFIWTDIVSPISHILSLVLRRSLKFKEDRARGGGPGDAGRERRAGGGRVLR